MRTGYNETNNATYEAFTTILVIIFILNNIFSLNRPAFPHHRKWTQHASQ